MHVLTRRRRTGLVASAVAALVASANASQGAYFSQSWGWVALAFLVPTTVALILGVVETPGRLRLAFAALISALGIWIGLSALWSISPAGSVRELERMLVYFALALAVALLLRRGDAQAVVVGVFCGATGVSCYALATRLFQDRFESYDDPDLPYRLSEPLGYWNALGLLAVLAILLGLAGAAHARRAVTAVVAAGSLPVLTSTLYFTYSRGAWVALAAGLAAMLLLDARRIRLLWTSLCVAPAAVVGVAIASRQEALTTEGSPLDDAVAEGRRLAVWLAALTVVAGALALGARWATLSVPVSRGTRRAVDVALGLGAVLAVSLMTVSLGGPTEIASSLRDRFEADLVVQSSDLNDRLFSLSGNGRVDHIEVAWEAAREKPVVGNGAGTYEYFWYLLRPARFDVRDAHSLYAEMLAEVGVVSLLLLVSALSMPFIGAIQARHSRVAPAAFGAFFAWAVHSAMDWNWEVVGVTSAALLAGGACMLASERRGRALLAGSGRFLLLAGTVPVSVFAVISLVGNQALFAAREAARQKDWISARDHARRAETLLPWSFEPLIVRGDAEAGLGHRAASLAAYRSAVSTDPENWVAWLRLAQVAQGSERAAAYARVRVLNPLEDDLPGVSARPSP